jgi:hypothetical protein
LRVPHLIKTMEYVKDASVKLFLLETEQEQLKKIKNNAAALIRKINPPLRREQNEDEKKSYLRAIEKLVGRRGTKYG